jgi:hypothetical protein
VKRQVKARELRKGDKVVGQGTVVLPPAMGLGAPEGWVDLVLEDGRGRRKPARWDGARFVEVSA